MHNKNIAKYIDHSILRPNISESDVLKQIEIGVECNVASICVMPTYLPAVVKRCASSTVIPCTVAGFPLGYNGLIDKLFCVRNSIHSGAKEIDYVININNVISEKWYDVQHEVEAVVNDCHSRHVKLKIIFETCYLTDDQKAKLTKICSHYGVDWVKTSTGFGPSGATLDDVNLMIKNVSGHTKVKASGGIKTWKDMKQYILAGVTRCGCSASKDILKEAEQDLHQYSEVA